MTDEYETIHPFEPKQPPSGEQLILTNVLRWQCPYCAHRNLYQDGMTIEVCMNCGKLARPVNETTPEPLTRSEDDLVKRLLSW